MFQEDQTEQRQLFAFTYRDLVPPESDVWLYVDLFGELDLTSFIKKYSYQGQEAKNPRLMLRTIFYGLTHGIVSGRKLEQLCRYDNRFIVLSGDLRPDRRTIDRFLNRHTKEIDELFIQVVKLAQKMKLVKLGRVAIDGTKLRGHTAQRKSMVYEKMSRAIEHIQENLKKLKEDLFRENSEDPTEIDDELPKEIKKQEERIKKIQAAKKQLELEHQAKGDTHKSGEMPRDSARKSLNDLEAQSIGKDGGGHIFGYNMQAAVDEESQIIVAAEVHSKVTDYEALPALLDQVESNCGKAAEEVLADLGYKSVENVKDIEGRGSKAIIAAGKGPRDYPLNTEMNFNEQLKAGANAHEYFCLAGKLIPSNKRKDGGTDLKLGETFCGGCNFATECKAYGKKTSQIMPEENRQILISHLSRSRTEEFKTSYRRRKAIVEPVFGNLKNKHMELLRAGRANAKSWWRLVCTALNIEKIIKSGQPFNLAFAG